MRRSSGVGVILLLALGIFTSPGFAQQTGPGPPDTRDRGGNRLLEQNYPNPFNPETRIPFFLPEEWFEDGQPVLVTIRIYNSLYQEVAVPTALNYPDRPGAPVQGLRYTVPGRHEAFWDGTYTRTGQEVPSGPYFLEFVVHGRYREVRSILVDK